MMYTLTRKRLKRLKTIRIFCEPTDCTDLGTVTSTGMLELRPNLVLWQIALLRGIQILLGLPKIDASLMKGVSPFRAPPPPIWRLKTKPCSRVEVAESSFRSMGRIDRGHQTIRKEE